MAIQKSRIGKVTLDKPSCPTAVRPAQSPLGRAALSPASPAGPKETGFVQLVSASANFRSDWNAFIGHPVLSQSGFPLKTCGNDDF